MTQEMKLLLALQQIENLTGLLQDNEYQQYMYYHLIQVQIEIQRQLTNLNMFGIKKVTLEKIVANKLWTV